MPLPFWVANGPTELVETNSGGFSSVRDSAIDEYSDAENPSDLEIDDLRGVKYLGLL